MHERKHQPKKYEDTANNSLEQNISSSKFWVDNEVFELIDMRKVKPRNYVTGRWALTIKKDKQGNFLRAKGQMGINQRREDFYYDALGSSRHNIDLVFDEENMEPE